jgi:Tfp pilus assembly protein FimV
MRHATAPVADVPSEPAAPPEPESSTADRAHRPGSADEVELRDREPEAASRPATGRRTKRPSVPSWDDIMFGAKQD